MKPSVPRRLCQSLLSLAAFLLILIHSPARVRSAPPAATQPASASYPISFVEETLPNGLQVIYAPIHNAPVVHVRVLYHVGSRDERPDRQGFAHMFEHMMFRGSAHVAPQEHMHLIDSVGGISNAFTSFDKTVYHDTIPAEDLEMALYLEADRMASFKVTDAIYQTERKVVAEEWRMRQNQPYGTMYEDYLKTAFVAHSYRWTPIGNMQQLLAAPVSELQDFFNTYYVPNNAVLVIAGDIDAPAAQRMVAKYFGWIPRGGEVPRRAPAEPPQTQPRSAVVPDRVPLPAVVIGWHIPPYRSQEIYTLSILSYVLGGDNDSRLSKRLVNNAHPLCVDAGSVDEPLEDGGFYGVSGTVLAGKNPQQVESELRGAVADIVAHGITDEELQRARTVLRVGLIESRQTATSLAANLGEEALVGGDANRVNTELASTDAVTAADVQAFAAKYLTPNAATMLLIKPDPLGIGARKAAAAAAAMTRGNAPVAPSTQPVAPRAVTFPPGYPTQPPMATAHVAAHFASGDSATLDAVRLVVLTDHRLPLVSFNLTMRHGSDSDPTAREGAADLTAAMLSRGAAGRTYEQLNDELASSGISLGVSDGGDVTTLSGSCTSDQLDHAIALARNMLLHPDFPPAEFAKLKQQTLGNLAVSRQSPTTVAAEQLQQAIYGPTSIRGRIVTPDSIDRITLADVKQFYRAAYRPDDALLVISGDVTDDQAHTVAAALIADWKPPGEPLPPVDYTMPASTQPASRRIILVDNPESRGVVIQMAVPAYDIHSDQKFAGTLASTILSSGIESRLMRYVRAEKGYVYGVSGTFQANRHGGLFAGITQTRPEVAADTIDAMFTVFAQLEAAGVSAGELTEAQRRVAGGLVMQMQTVDQQARLRAAAILNSYPDDYYNRYAEHIDNVTAQQVQAVMQQYVNDGQMTIVVVAPAEAVKDQLQRLGAVQVLPMPAMPPSAAADALRAATSQK